jgi:sensor histidine kinase YesM
MFLHVALWALFIFYPYILRHSFGGPAGETKRNVSFEIHNFLSIITWIALFYVNAYVLMPKYFNRRKYGQYLLVVIVIYLALSVINWISFHVFLAHVNFRILGLVLFYLIPTSFILLWSIAYRLLLDRLREDRIKAETQNENLKTELSFLRSQVSPHFMFNVMNNMVALARKKSDILEPSLIKLSSLLRYMLYETDDEEVSLQKEIEYLQSYIDLQKQRFADNAKIDVSLNDVVGQLRIHPMLLIPFVENAFKHGTGMFMPEIAIRLKTDQRKLLFEVSNRYSVNGKEIKDRSSGIGLTNVRRRLNLLYGDNHKLQIEKDDTFYTVKLEMLL